MTTAKISLRGLCVLGLASAAAALGATAGNSTEGIRGTYDPATKSFTPLAPSVTKTAAPTPKIVTGTYKISVTIKVSPKIPDSVQLAAAVAITAKDPDTYNPVLQYVTNVGGYLARSGDAGTLSLTIPYVYKLADPNAPVTFALQVYEPAGGTKFQPTSNRTTTIKLPKNGATTLIVLGDTI